MTTARQLFKSACDEAVASPSFETQKIRPEFQP